MCFWNHIKMYNITVLWLLYCQTVIFVFRSEQVWFHRHKWSLQSSKLLVKSSINNTHPISYFKCTKWNIRKKWGPPILRTISELRKGICTFIFFGFVVQHNTRDNQWKWSYSDTRKYTCLTFSLLLLLFSQLLTLSPRVHLWLSSCPLNSFSVGQKGQDNNFSPTCSNIKRCILMYYTMKWEKNINLLKVTLKQVLTVDSHFWCLGN